MHAGAEKLLQGRVVANQACDGSCKAVGFVRKFAVGNEFWMFDGPGEQLENGLGTRVVAEPVHFRKAGRVGQVKSDGACSIVARDDAKGQPVSWHTVPFVPGQGRSLEKRPERTFGARTDNGRAYG